MVLLQIGRGRLKYSSGCDLNEQAEGQNFASTYYK